MCTQDQLTEFEPMLKSVSKIVTPTPELTLFAIGGRGYYENPTSDLLAFFMKPQALHGLGDLFLATFLECMGVDCSQLNWSYVDIAREVQTEKQKRIDLQILGPDWCLLIENKIYHWQANPFSDYDSHATSLHKRNKFLAILSPNGKAEAVGWKGVSYAQYFEAILKKMPALFCDTPHTKWHLFAREFILHIKNELDRPPMTEDQASFIEKHADKIAELKKLESAYRIFLQQQLKEALSKIIPIDLVSLRDEGWAIRCYCSQWGKSNLALWRHGQNFMVTAYLVGLTDEQRKSASTFFYGMKHATEGAWLLWYPQPGFETRVKAIMEFIRFGQYLTKLFQTSPEPVQPLGEMLNSGNITN